ncbi:MAG: nucleotide-binding protein [Acidobacteriota bacterium]|nr:nucleotide-binding protein [Acidobacteriota bacterium]
MNTLRIGVVTPLSGRSAQMGIGLKDSVQFIFERRKGDLQANDIDLELVVRDDEGNPSRSASLAKQLYEEGVICIIGPCDSLCAYEILTSGICEECPIISPLATATMLTKMGAPNFFRMTAPDNIRAEALVRYAAKKYPDKCFQVYSFFDTPKSYAQQLTIDIRSSLEAHNCYWRIEEFIEGAFPERVPKMVEPALFCSPSAEIVRVIPHLIRKGFKSQVFTLGSNSNLLIPELVGTVVVADLDRQDTNILISEEIERFKRTSDSTGDPCVAAMNCISLLVNFFIDQKETIRSTTVSEIRKTLIAALKTPQKGLFGSVMFKDNGEMIGSEHISILKIASGREGVTFEHLSKSEKAITEAVISSEVQKPLRWLEEGRKPRIFIGSSTEGLRVAEELQLCLDRVAECTLWNQSFDLSRTNIEGIVAAAARSDFAILALTPDDVLNKRDVTAPSPRDNLIFELGLFTGMLGRTRTFMVYPRDISLHLPSDLSGVTAATYAVPSGGDLSVVLGPVCTRIKKAIELFEKDRSIKKI